LHLEQRFMTPATSVLHLAAARGCTTRRCAASQRALFVDRRARRGARSK
jgi:hypothetical protein